MNRKTSRTLLAAVVLLAALLPALSASGASIDGMITPFGDSGDTFIAVPIALEAGQGVKSLRWYNNDGSTALGEVMLVADSGGSPDLSQVFYSRTGVYGSSDAWTQLDMPSSVAGPQGKLFAVFKIPAMFRSAIGVGGGPGLGYSTVAQSSHVTQISADGVEWVSLASTVDLAVETINAAAGPAKAVSGAAQGPGGESEATVSYKTGITSAYPNPANPSVRVRFEMASPGNAKIAVYNVRGQIVRSLIDQWVPVGEHQAQWLGTDDLGKRVSSGVYYVRFEAGGITERTRITLVR
jgi:FlgD Ig-like domain